MPQCFRASVFPCKLLADTLLEDGDVRLGSHGSMSRACSRRDRKRRRPASWKGQRQRQRRQAASRRQGRRRARDPAADGPQAADHRARPRRNAHPESRGAPALRGPHAEADARRNRDPAARAHLSGRRDASDPARSRPCDERCAASSEASKISDCGLQIAD